MSAEVVWFEFEIYGHEPPELLRVCYFLNEGTGKRWAKKFGARFTKHREVTVQTDDGITGQLEDGREVRLQCVRPENLRPRN